MSFQRVMILATCSLVAFGQGLFAATPSRMSEFPEGERLVYTRVVEAFRRNDLRELSHQRQVLEHNYPASVHLDNAYYLDGLLQFQNSRFPEALRQFDVVRDRFVKSNKRPAALFALSRVYDQLNLGVQSRRVLENLMKDYPGSPEAQRAWMQLRLDKSPLAGAARKVK